jgi:hypothetical protein
MVKLSNHSICLGNLSRTIPENSVYKTPLEKMESLDHPCASYWHSIFVNFNVFDIFEILRYIMNVYGLDVKEFADHLDIKTTNHLRLILDGSVKTLSRDKYKSKLNHFIPTWILDIYFEDNERFKRW